MTSNCDKEVSSEDAKKSFGTKPDPCSFDSTVSGALYNAMTGNVAVNFHIMEMLNVFPWMAMANMSKKAVQAITERIGRSNANIKVGTLKAIDNPTGVTDGIRESASGVASKINDAVDAMGTRANEMGESVISSATELGKSMQQTSENVATSTKKFAQDAKDVGESISRTTSAVGKSMMDRLDKLRGKTGGGDMFTEEECSFF